MTALQSFTATYGGHPFTLQLNLSSTEDVATNTSTVSWALYTIKTTANTPYVTGASASWGFSPVGSGAWGPYNFNGAIGQTILMASGSFVVAHNSDGTGAITGFGFSGNGNSTITTAAGSGTYTLDTIPRATQPTVSPTSGNTGVTYAIDTSTVASSSFFHDISYSVDGGSTYTSIVSNQAATTTSTNWTPAATLFPNTGSATAIIKVDTRSSSGGTIIGSKTVNLPLTVPSTVVPVVSSVSFVDSQTSAPDMPTLMGGAGRFVQGWSKLKPTATASGASGSTVTADNITLNGQTTPSGTAFGLPVGLSGAVPYSAIATDSRGRNSAPYTSTVAVTAYSFPNVPTPAFARTSDAAGLIPSPTGTYISILPLISVSDLTFGGSQKNLLEYQIRTKPVGGSWTTVSAWGASGVSGNTWTSRNVLAGYSSATDYLVEISVRDLFGKNGYNTANTIQVITVTVPSASAFMDWDQGIGIGLGHYRQQGILDILGDVYETGNMSVTGDVAATTLHQGTHPVVDFSDSATTSVPGIIQLAAPTDAQAGTDNTKALTALDLAVDRSRTGTVDSGWAFGRPTVNLNTALPDGTAAVTAFISPDLDNRQILPGSAVLVSHTTAGGWVIIKVYGSSPTFSPNIPIALGPGWALFSDLNNDAGEYGDALQTINTSQSGVVYATMTSTGIVVVHGLIARTVGTSAVAGEVVAGPLPSAMRPARTQVFATGQNSAFSWLYITPDGNIRIGASTGAWAAGNWQSLEGVRFRAASAGLTLNTFTLATGLSDLSTSLGTGDTATAHTHGYTVDSDNIVIFEGVITCTTAVASGVNIANITALSQSATDIFMLCRSGVFMEARFGGTGGTGAAGGFLVNETALAVGNWVSLSNLIIAPNSTAWGLVRLGKPTGSVYGSGYMTPSILRTAEGFVLLRGLMAVGTGSSELIFLPPNWRPRYTGLYGNSGAAAFGALNIGLSSGGSGWALRSSIQLVVGSGSYSALGGMCFSSYS